MTKTFDQRRNQQVIEMRRDNARACVDSLRWYRKDARMSEGELIAIASQVRGAIELYRQTIHALINYI